VVGIARHWEATHTYGVIDQVRHHLFLPGKDVGTLSDHPDSLQVLGDGLLVPFQTIAQPVYEALHLTGNAHVIDWDRIEYGICRYPFVAQCLEVIVYGTVSQVDTTETRVTRGNLFSCE
jgi:hypothetical protein